MDPYTPKVRTGSRRSHLTLSAKQYTKITGTIASVRRTRQLLDDDLREESLNQLDKDDEPSFIAEKSFVRAPLNSRVPVVSSSSYRVDGTRKGKAKATSKEDSLEKVPVEVQEAMILEDLLFVLMGIEGTFITHPPDYAPEEDYLFQGVHFVTAPSLDASLRDLVERILPLATYYTAIASFIEQRSHLDYGLVNHALCASIRDMLKEYHTLLSQLEHAYTTSPHFSLQKLWFYVHPTLHTLHLIYTLITDLAAADASSPSSSEESEDESEEIDPEEAAKNEALGINPAALKAVLSSSHNPSGNANHTPTSLIPVKGGEVLSILYTHHSHTSGSPSAQSLYGRLMRDAGRPYVRILEEWMWEGKLEDGCEEVCVKESRGIDKGLLEVDYTDEYWERRYTLRDGSSLSPHPSHQHRHQAGVPAPRNTPDGRLPGGACVPPQLEKWKFKVLLAGKYLNVIRECGIEVGGRGGAGVGAGAGGGTREGDEEVGMGDEKFYKSIQDAYTYANRTLLTVLLHRQQLIPHLRALKHFFFLSQSSFLTHFLDLAAGELRKSVRSVSVSKLQSLLEIAVAGEGVPGGHVHVHGGKEGDGGAGGKEGGKEGEGEVELGREDVKVVMASSGLYEWLMKVLKVSGVIGGEEGGAGGIGTGEEHEDGKRDDKEKDKDKKGMLAIDALSLDYTVKFPLSLVISRKTILRYQLLFRFLLHLRHVEQNLSAMWMEQKGFAWRTPTARMGSGFSEGTTAEANGNGNGAARGPGHPELERWRNRVFLLRARMLAFVQQMLAFATFEVLEPNWRLLEAKLAKVETVDQLLRDHVDFLDTCLKECMLTSSKLLGAFSRLIVTCSTFALYSASFTKSAKQAMAALEASGGDPASVPMDKRWDILNKFETNFNHWLQVHVDCVQFYASSENVSLLPLVVRLNSVRVT
ncbi:hypothetical protein BD410DRAFT_829604 [Rickenella mellea]|uniref:Spindle pole body component n=1 Tax=Rickenella mellea TaxID=50990 RepID=A0A4Y7Q061_9AGAM|nr:hypothetical protein BD410DRAFT_829604 [Rickenella mellea]